MSSLESQRDDLLEALRRLRSEHAAGEIDDEDFTVLEEDLTERAAAVLRRIEKGEESPRRQERSVSPRARRLAWIAGVVIFALVVGVLAANAAGRRSGSETFTGDIRQTTRDLLLVARDQAAEGHYDEALGTYEEVLEMSPTNAEALAYTGWVGYTMAGDMGASEALEYLDEAVESDPDLADARVFRAVILRDLGRIDAALADLDALDDQDVPSFMEPQLAALREDLGSVDPEMAEVAAANALLAEGQLLAAIELLDDVLERSPENVDALLAKAHALGQAAGQATGADREELLVRGLDLLERAQRVAPEDPMPLAYRASLLASVGRGDQARAVLEELLGRDDLPGALRAEAEELRESL